MASNPLADVERSFVQFGSAPKQIFVTDRRLDLHRAAMRDYEAGVGPRPITTPKRAAGTRASVRMIAPAPR
jgi:hypothetical protein